MCLYLNKFTLCNLRQRFHKCLAALLSIMCLLCFSPECVCAADISTEVQAVEVESSEVTSEFVEVDKSISTAEASESGDDSGSGSAGSAADYSGELEELCNQVADMQLTLSMMCEYLTYLAGFGLFAVIVVLCVFSYKFFKMFF